MALAPPGRSAFVRHFGGFLRPKPGVSARLQPTSARSTESSRRPVPGGDLSPPFGATAGAGSTRRPALSDTSGPSHFPLPVSSKVPISPG